MNVMKKTLRFLARIVTLTGEIEAVTKEFEFKWTRTN